MTEPAKLVATSLWLVIPLLVAWWVWLDANRLKRNGANLNPTLWVVLVFLVWVVGFPAYLYLRRTTWQSTGTPLPTTSPAAQDAGPHQLTPSNKVDFRVLYWVCSVMIAVMLSMYATAVAINRYPVPDGDEVNLGIFLFFLIGSISLAIIGGLIVSGLREGRKLEAGLIASIFAGGLLVASAVGLSTWAVGWFAADRPWVSQVFHAVAPIFCLIYLWWLPRRSAAHSIPAATGERRED